MFISIQLSIVIQNLENRINRAITAEKSRLNHKSRYKVLGTASSKILDDLTSYTADVFKMQIAIVNFVDGDNLWPKRVSLLEPNRESNVCSLAVINDMVSVIESQLEEPARITNPIIAAEMGMKFYRAVPIIINNGIQVGTICIMSKEEREFLLKEQDKLNLIASIIGLQMDKRIVKKIAVQTAIT